LLLNKFKDEKASAATSKEPEKEAEKEKKEKEPDFELLPNPARVIKPQVSSYFLIFQIYFQM